MSNMMEPQCFFDIFKFGLPDSCAVCSYIKKNLENMNIYPFKHDAPKANIYISEWMNDISIARETYSEIVRQKTNH